MSKLKPIINQVIDELKKPENNPANHKENMFIQFAKLSATVGKVGENMAKATVANEKQFSVFFNGIRNGILRVATMSIMLLHYLDTHFDHKGQPVDQTENNSQK